jgi:hypothetical protein
MLSVLSQIGAQAGSFRGDRQVGKAWFAALRMVSMPRSKISPAELRERQTPRGLVTHARGFFDAAALIVSTVGLDAGGAHLRKPGFHHPFYYLSGHSIELSMKAILLASGRSHADLKKISR